MGGAAQALPVLKDIATTWTELDGFYDSDRARMLQFLFKAVLPAGEWTAWWAFFKQVDMEEDKAMVGDLLQQRIAPITDLVNPSNSDDLRKQCEGYWTLLENQKKYGTLDLSGIASPRAPQRLRTDGDSSE